MSSETKTAGRPLKVGLMIPATNTTMEHELTQWLPEGSSCRVLRVKNGAAMLTREDIPDYSARCIELAGGFADAPLDVVVYGCTAAGFISGPAKDREIGAALARVTGRPSVTTAGS